LRIFLADERADRELARKPPADIGYPWSSAVSARS
jgi:hypothetical protein